MANEQIRIETIKIKDIYQFACRVVDQAKPNELFPIDICCWFWGTVHFADSSRRRFERG